MRTPALRRLAVGFAAPALLVVGLSACGAGDASRSDVQDELEEGGLTEEQASCVTDRLFDELDQGQINDLYEADNAEEAGEDVAEVLTTSVTDCASG